MSLEGTLDAFALPEVLRLLVAGRSGALRLTAPHGSGCLWLDNGRIVRAEADRAEDGATTAEVVFELLRLEGGSFAFDDDDDKGASGVGLAPGQMPVEVDAVLSQAEALLVEWREVESVVPAALATVRWSDSLPEAHVTVGHRQWHVLAAVARSTTVADVACMLALGDVPTRRAVKELVDAGLVAVDASALPVRPRAPMPVRAAAPAPTPPVAPTAPLRPWREYLANDALVAAVTQVDLGDAVRESPATDVPAAPGSTPMWAGDDVLDEAFAEWVPGPTSESHPVERSLVDLDEAHGADEEARGLLDKLLASLRS